MDFGAIGKLVPQLLLPHAQEWAGRAGHTQLSRILEDNQLRALLQKLGEEMETQVRSSNEETERGSGSGRSKRSRERSTVGGRDDDLDYHDAIRRLRERLIRLEQEHTSQQQILAFIKEKARPFSAALGSCNECLVGVAFCPRCGGKGQVGAYEPDLALLQSAVVNPLAARGVAITLGRCDETKVSRTTQRSPRNRKEQGHVGNHLGK